MGIKHLSLIFMLILVWGFNFVVIKWGLEGMPPVLLAAARFFFTAIPAIFFFKRPSIPFRRIALYGLVIFSLQFALFFIGMNLGVPPGLASILMQMHVFFSLLLAVLIFHEKVRIWQIVGALVSFSGIAVAALNVEKNTSLAGFFLVIGAAAFWGTGSAISKTLGKVNMISLVVWGSMVAWPPLLLLSLLIEGPASALDAFKHLSWTSAGAVFYLSYLSTLFAYGLWSWLIHHLPLSTVAPFTLLVPVVALISSALVLGEPIQGWKIAASLLIIGGICIHLFASRFSARKAKKRADQTLL
jgi:O-acetylserine/cysteine efflux transporter